MIRLPSQITKTPTTFSMVVRFNTLTLNKPYKEWSRTQDGCIYSSTPRISRFSPAAALGPLQPFSPPSDLPVSPPAKPILESVVNSKDKKIQTDNKICKKKKVISTIGHRTTSGIVRFFKLGLNKHHLPSGT